MMVSSTDRARRPAAPALPRDGFTLIEILLVVALIATVAAIAVPMYFHSAEAARAARAIGDVRSISLEIGEYQARTGSYPDTLVDVGAGGLRDPWGNGYRYLNLTDPKNNGKARKDKNLVPLNTDYDLYSVGRDGITATPLTAKASQDDIVRANNGAFVGKGSDY
jgi:general secretion pathway protein G